LTIKTSDWTGDQPETNRQLLVKWAAPVLAEVPIGEVRTEHYQQLFATMTAGRWIARPAYQHTHTDPDPHTRWPRMGQFHERNRRCSRPSRSGHYGCGCSEVRELFLMVRGRVSPGDPDSGPPTSPDGPESEEQLRSVW
jgi:hypothetical protein